MRIIEVDTGNQIEKYEYVSEDIDTYIVSSDDIDLSHEGFIIRQRQYDNSIIKKKCKLVKKEDVKSHYSDWNETRTYFCGISCSYKEMDGFIRISALTIPDELISEFTYEEYMQDRGDQFPPIKSHRYYKDISYDDARLQRDVIEKKHRDYIIDAHGITKEMSEHERKQLTIEYLIDKFGNGNLAIDDFGQFSALLFGSYGYRIPDRLYSTDLDAVFDRVLPCAYELYSSGGPYAGSNFLGALGSVIVNGYWHLNSVGQFATNLFWIEDGKTIHPSEDYAFFMNIQLHLKLMDKHQEYPYTLLNLKNIYHWLNRRYDKYLTRHNPVYWNNKIVCNDLSNYVKCAMKKLVYFKQFD